MSSLRDALRRLLRPEERSRSARTVELGCKSSEPIVRVGAEPRPDRSGPGDLDLVEAIERWLAASM